ncbi:glycosyltransferase [uncultured Parabacteroides sp.]|uniref:glycosyltransferase n=1 Tax=uncultured Parabacteroides sp. TaxID=512312 RepID=UPI00258D73D6|nr:glycosyltransferase [uncultured Parabacteroides sp.]
MKVLYISRVNPFINGGGPFASRAYIDAFMELSEHFTLMIADSCIVPDNYKQSAQIIYVPQRPFKEKVLFPFTGRLHRFIPFIYDYWKNMNEGEFDTVVLNGGVLAGDMVDFFKRKNIKVITIHHNVERKYHKDNKTIESFGGLYTGYINKNEKKALLNSDINLAISRDDIKELCKIYDLPPNIHLNYIGCFENKERQIVKNLSLQQPHTLAITGSLHDYQTKDGIIQFLKRNYPLIIKKYPDSRIIIAGRDPSKKLIEMCKFPNIELIANPLNMDVIIQEASVYIAPTRLGSGLKLRIMDGLRNGKAILTHPTSARGYDLFHDKNYFRQYHSPKDFMEQLDYLLSKNFNPNNIKTDYQKYFSFQSGLERLNNLLKTTNKDINI